MSFTPSAVYLELGDGFAEPVEPARFPLHEVRYVNDRWARRVGLGELGVRDWIARFGRFVPFEGSLETPLALRYHGHQFRSYNPQIGDGRGFLYAQLVDPVDGRLLDFGTKGSGRTPFSRTGDGRLTLKGGVREILATEMLEALGVYTSKSFSLIETGERLTRSDEPSPTRSAVLVRLSHSHVRFGTFQKLALFKERTKIESLVEWCVRHHHPDLASATDLPRAFYERVVDRSATLVATWMAAGFVHGVLNTDNLDITGESFDYGPWRFLPYSDPSFTAAYFDEQGLYAFGRQPSAALWNLSQLASCLTLVADVPALEPELQRFEELYRAAFRKRMLAVLGLKPIDEEQDLALIKALFAWMGETRAPWPQVFFDWFGGQASETRAGASPLAKLYAQPGFEPVRRALLEHQPERPERLDHAYFKEEAPVSLVIEEVEAVWAHIAERDDWAPFNLHIERIEKARQALCLP